jgi:outer membrane protein TolC
MIRIFLFFVSIFLWASSLTTQGQQAGAYLFTLEDVVQLAQDQSLMAIQARHTFRAAYFSNMSYKATFLPKLTLTTSPTSWDKSIRTIESEKNGVYTTSEVKTNTLTSTAGLALSQNIGFTGGSVSLGSDFQRRQNFLEDNSDRTTQFTTKPIQLSLTQPLNGYNPFRWDKQIEPLRYEEAKQNYLVQMEAVASRAVRLFFQLAIAEQNQKIAETNMKNQQELYTIAQGRHQLGNIAEDQLLQVQLKYMQSESALNSSEIQIVSTLSQLRSFLGFNENAVIKLQTNPEVPSFQVNYDEALNLAMTRNPEIISYNRRVLEAERDVSLAKSRTGITLDLAASFGTNKTGYLFNEAYSRPFDDREGISLSIKVPILDWNQSRNRYRNAQSQLEVMQAQVAQSETEFKQDIFLQVMNFNMQENQLRLAAISDTIAQKSYDISFQRYMIGKGDITVLNLADTEKDRAKVNWMNELRTYWTLYYTIRSLTLFDFFFFLPIEEDFERIMGE